MRLLSSNDDGTFSLSVFLGKEIPSYAILSHTWEADDQEVTFQDLMSHTATSKKGYRKIQFCGEQAKAHGLQYFWVDSCCIDKTNSTELQTAINSMFRWYRDAAKSYVYLSDVLTRKRSQSSDILWEEAFRRSRWFTRGWTLQELLAPRSVEFFSRDSMRLGDKDSLEQQIHEVTGIAIEALRGCPLSQFSEDERRSWAIKRETTIEEDQVYCLLGIFDVYLPLIYGEGKAHALGRLQCEIERRLDSYTQVKLSDKEHRCIQVLRTSEYEQFKDRNPNRLEGTCLWVLRHDNFLDWRINSSSVLLWVSADPGCGKSVLSKYLVDDEIGNTGQTTCYFFFKNDSEEQKSITVALSALLHQLFSEKPGLVKHAIADYTAEGDKLPQSFHKLWSILIKATADPKAGEIICVLDALDECAEAGRYQLISAVKAYQQASFGKSTSQLKFFITSRPYLDIERRFADLIRNLPTIRLHGEKESKAISREINIVIKSKVLELGIELNLDDSEQLTLQDELLGMTHRTYLWLTLIVEVIRDEIILTRKRIKQIVGTLPDTIDQAYETILSRIKDKDKKKAQKLLHLIVAAVRPLTLRETNVALAIEDKHRSYTDLDLENEERFESTVKNLCGLFVSVVDHKVYLIHQTAKDFLVAKSTALGSRWKYSLEPVESNLVMAKACITCLNFQVSEGDFGQHSREDFFDYAACLWITHFRPVQSSTTTVLALAVLQISDPRSTLFQNWYGWYRMYSDRYTGYRLAPEDFANSLMVSSYFDLDSIVKLLLKLDLISVDARNVRGLTSLLLAARRGHKGVVQLLLRTGQADINAKDEDGLTALLYASKNGYRAIVQLLLRTGQVDVNAKDKNGPTALLYASGNGYRAIVQLLLRTGQVDVNAKDKDGLTALLYASGNGYRAIVQLLLRTGQVDVNAKDKDGLTALLYASGNGHGAIVQLLLTTGQVNINAKSDWGATALSLAVRNSHENVVQLLIETGQVDANAVTYKALEETLCLAAEKGYEAVVELLLRACQVDVNTEAKWNGRPPLLRAARNGHETIVKLLLETGQVDVNRKDQLDRTALSWATMCGSDTVIQVLLETGQCDVNAKDIWGKTAISYAADKGYDTVVQLLLETGQVDIDANDESVSQALSRIAKRR